MRLGDRLTLLMLGGIWGSSFLLMRIAEPEFGAVALITLRVTTAAALLTGLLATRGGLGALRGRAGAFVRVGALNSAVPFTLYAWSTGSLGAGLPSVLNATVPLFGALVAWAWMRERLTPLRALGLGLGFVGVVVLTWPKLVTAGADSSALGVAAGLLAALCYAVSAHDSKRTFAGVPPLAVAAGSMLGASALLIPPALFLLPSELPSARALAAALALGVVCTSFAYVLYFRLLETLGATRAITVTYLIPCFGLLWGCVFLAEPLTTRTLVGSGVVLAGTAIVLRAGQARPSLCPSSTERTCPSSPPRSAP